MSLATPDKLEKLRKALHAKAKEEVGYRFYQLYDKVYRPDMLAFAYRVSRANGGKPGVDGQTFEEIESAGLEGWLDELAETLRKKTYRAAAVRRVWIDKGNGKRRPLGIPTIRDRVVQTAMVLVLEPIFEADLEPEQYAYRPNRSAQDRQEKGLHAIPTSTCIKTWDSSACRGERATFRGRRHDPGESRMREICTSGSPSGDWKRSYDAE